MAADLASTLQQRYLRHYGSGAYSLFANASSSEASMQPAVLVATLANYERAVQMILAPLAGADTEESLEALLVAVEKEQAPDPPLAAGAGQFWAMLGGSFGANCLQRQVEAIVGLAYVEQVAGQPALARTFVTLMLQMFKARPSGSGAEAAACQGRLLSCQGRLLLESGRWRQAKEVLQQAVEALSKGGVEPQDVVVLQTKVALAQVVYLLDDVDAANVSMTRLMESLDEMLEQDPSAAVVDLYADAAELRVLCMRAVGGMTNEEATSILRRSLAERKKALGEEHPQVARSLLSLSAFLLETDELDSAEAAAQSALALRDKACFAGPNTALAESLIALADVMGRQGLSAPSAERCGEARRAYRQAISMLEQLHGNKHPLAAAALQCLGDLLMDADDVESAANCFARSLAVKEELWGAYAPQVESSVAALGVARHRMSQLEEALQLYSRSLELRKAVYGEKNMQSDSALRNLGAVLLDLKKPDEAEPYFKQALALEQAELGSSHPSLLRTLSWLEETYRQLKRESDAVECGKRISVIQKAVAA